ncbi:uncharacterized protein [Asterias amurensis]|uniref:uncharacterized protein n=1 Tax=Asterias amurensis TaxID=7602 RepID=UPI003AB311F3
MNLLSSVYSQSWPAPDPNKQHHRGLQGKMTARSPRRTKNSSVSSSRIHQQKYGSSEQQGCHGKSILALQGRKSPRVASQQMAMTPSRHAGLDEGTYKWKTWTNYQEDCGSNSNDLTLYKITQDTFRKLSQQVQEVNAQISKFHNNGFKSYHMDGNVSPVIRATQLAASLPHQSPRISREPATDDMAPQCTSVQRANRRRPHSHSLTSNQRQSSLPQRPHSTTALYGRATSEFDQLTPKMIGALSDGKQRTLDQSQLGPFDIIANEAKPEILEVGEDQSDTDDEESEMPRHYRVRPPPDFDLPAEDMDIHDIRGRFQHRSSSAGKKKQEPYPEPLSEPYCYFDLLELSLLKEDWRHAVRTVPDGIEAQLIDRLIEMERLQIASAELERGVRVATPKRVMSAMQIRKGWNTAASVPTERAQSALARPRQSKNCSPACLQPLCSGTCETKQDSLAHGGCHHCKQEYCQGSCTEFGYHLHIRQPRDEEVNIPPPRPKSCKSCNSRTSSRKSTINNNTVILGRPKSAFATFSSAKQRSGKSKSISSEARSVSDQMAQLELSSTPDAGGDKPARPKTAPGSSRSKPRGRNSMLPGKSFTSQRRHSLTDDPISTSAAKMNPKHMRIKSAKLKSKQKKVSKR